MDLGTDARGLAGHDCPAVGDAVRLLVPIRTLPVEPGDVGTVSAVLGSTHARSIIAVIVDHSPLPVILFHDEVEPVAG